MKKTQNIQLKYGIESIFSVFHIKWICEHANLSRETLKDILYIAVFNIVPSKIINIIF